MHILMIAPQPFFEPRGTPFSEFHRIRALTSLGHTVDLVTYPFGSDKTLPGLTIVRSLRPPFVTRVRIGPSWAKVPLDFLLVFTVMRLALTRRYDAVHSHEEGGLVGVIVARWLKIPHLYDMHSSLPQQITNFGFGRAKRLVRLFDWIERVMIRHSRVIVVICPQLETVVREIDKTVPMVLIENAPGSGSAPVAGTGRDVRASFGLTGDVPVVVYTGTFEHYQGLDLLFEAAVTVRRQRPDVRFLLVGGEAAQVDAAHARCRDLGLADAVVFAGQRPAEDIPAFLDAANVLVSPRSTGTNTPLKIYQYLRSGRVIVATRLLTHTQVLADETAILTEPTPAAFADGLLLALTDTTRAAQIGEAARRLAEVKYSDEAYLDRTRTAVAFLTRERPPAQAGGAS